MRSVDELSGIWPPAIRYSKIPLAELTPACVFCAPQSVRSLSDDQAFQTCPGFVLIPSIAFRVSTMHPDHAASSS
jgi:hypothetical protein